MSLSPYALSDYKTKLITKFPIYATLNVIVTSVYYDLHRPGKYVVCYTFDSAVGRSVYNAKNTPYDSENDTYTYYDWPTSGANGVSVDGYTQLIYNPDSYLYNGIQITSLINTTTYVSRANSQYNSMPYRLKQTASTIAAIYKNYNKFDYFDAKLNPTNLSDWYMPYRMEYTSGSGIIGVSSAYYKHFSAFLIGGGGGGGKSGNSGSNDSWSGGGGGGGGGGIALFYSTINNISLTTNISYSVGGGGGINAEGGTTYITVNGYKVNAYGGNRGSKGYDNPRGNPSPVAASGNGGYGWSFEKNGTDHVKPFFNGFFIITSFLAKPDNTDPIAADPNGTGTAGISAGSDGDQTGNGGTINQAWLSSAVIPSTANSYGNGGNGGAPVITDINDGYGYDGNGGGGGYIAIYLFKGS
jgi:uncharacterized membrane protein YgcG